MNILIACEESQRVCIKFREKGHNAFSCDIIDCSGGHPEWHIKQDVLPLLNGQCGFYTADGKFCRIEGTWDMIIAHPPCTFLAVSGNRWFSVEKYGQEAIQRKKKREEAAEFFMTIAEAKCSNVNIVAKARPDNTAIHVRRPSREKDLLMAKRPFPACSN